MKIYLLLGLCILLAGIAGAVSVENSNFRIDVSPDEALIQSTGFTYYGTYTWKGALQRTEDVAFCFDTKINGRVAIYLNGGFVDVTNQFKYRSFPIAKGDCYYVQDVTWQPNETKLVRFSFLPSDYRMVKWDTYFGNITALRVDLRLDPVFNATLYEIGTSRSDSYDWVAEPFMSYSGNQNPDISSYSGQLNNHNFTTVINNISVNATSILNNTFIGGTLQSLAVASGINITVLKDFNLVGFGLVDNVQCNVWFVVNKRDIIYTILKNGTFTNAFASIDLNLSAGNTYYIMCDNDAGTYNAIANVTYNAPKTYEYFRVDAGCKADGTSTNYCLVGNRTTAWNIRNITFKPIQNTPIINSSGYLRSNYISLPIFVESFRMNNTLAGDVSVNVSFNNGSSWTFLNATDVSSHNISGSVNSNNVLSYRVFLNNAGATLFNLSFVFNPLELNLTFNVNELFSGALIGYNVTFTGSSITNLSCITQACSIMLPSGVYNITILRNGYYSQSYGNYNIGNSSLTISTSLYNHRFNLTAFNASTIVSGYNVTLFDLNWSASQTVTAPNNTNFIHSLSGDYYNLTFRDNSNRYAQRSYNFSAGQSSSTNITIALLPRNTLNLTIRDELTNALVVGTAVVTVIAPSGGSASYNIVNGSGSISSLETGNNTLSFSLAGYGVRSRVYAVPEASFQNVIQFLSTNCTATLFNYYTSGGVAIPNVNGLMYGFVNGTQTLLESHISDITGKSQFCTASNTYYLFNNTATGYAENTFALNPVLFTSYNIVMADTSGGTVEPTASVSYNPTLFRKGQVANFTITFQSVSGSYLSYDWILSGAFGNISGSGVNGSGETFVKNYNLSLENYGDQLLLYYEYNLTNGFYYNQTQTFRVMNGLSNRTIANLGTEHYGLLIGDRIMTVTIIALILSGLAFLASGSLGFGLVMGGVVFAMFSDNGFIPQTITYLVIIVGVFMIFSRGQNG